MAEETLPHPTPVAVVDPIPEPVAVLEPLPELGPQCPNCKRDVADLELIVKGKCGWCHLEDVREKDRVAAKARHDDNTWNGIAGERARYQRDMLLSQSDWAVLPDSPVDGIAWRAYRKALRDIPQMFSNPKNITWPTAPPKPGGVRPSEGS